MRAHMNTITKHVQQNHTTDDFHVNLHSLQGNCLTSSHSVLTLLKRQITPEQKGCVKFTLVVHTEAFHVNMSQR